MAEQQTSDTLLGATIGNYRPEQLLGQSKYGPFFLARSLENGKHTLMRFLTPPADLSAEERILYLGLFQQEASRVALLHHPHILPLLDYGNYQGMPYLVLPNFSARTLRAQLTKHGPPDLLTVRDMLDQIASALEYAHAHGVLHRNLSTDSVLLDRRLPAEHGGTAVNTLLVADFGIMRMLELARQDGQAYRLYASSESIAPEQVQPGGQPLDTSADVYALGAVLYRLLTGLPVFNGQTRADILRQHLEAPVPPVKIAARSTGDFPIDGDAQMRMSSLLAKAMAKNPAHRFQHPGELADAFSTLVAPNDTARKTIAVPVPPVQPAQPAQDALTTRPAAPVAPMASLRPMPVRQPLQRRRISRRNAIIIGGSSVAVAAIALLLGTHYLSGPSGSTASTTSTGGATKPAAPPAPTTSNAPTAPAGTHSGTVIARAADVPLNSAKTFPIANSNNPGILVHLSNNRFVAFNSTCTHAGCAVAYSQQDKLLECPCHQAAFDPARGASVVQGPAQTPLAAIAITVNSDGTITTNG